MSLSKKKKVMCISILLLMASFFAIVFFNKKTKITWYIANLNAYGFSYEDIKPYQELHSEQFDLFNQRLKELKIPAKVVFKAMPGEWDLADGDEMTFQRGIEISGNKVQEIISKDKDADIMPFSHMEYQRFISLDSYFHTDGMKKAKISIPEALWEVNQINAESYQIPRTLVSAKETIYAFYKPFLEQYQIDVDEETVRKMSPRRVIEWLSTYFAGETLLDGKYYITSGSDLFYVAYLGAKIKPMLEGGTIDVMLDYETGTIQDMYSNKKVLEYLDLCQWIYKNNIDAHEEQKTISNACIPVFKMMDIPVIEELGGEASEKGWEAIQLGDRWLSQSVGNGILKSSKNKELAVEVLAATVYDKELSDIMIHGVLEKDYTLQDGYVVYKDASKTPAYSIGNNFIAYPTESEIPDKKEVSEQLLSQIQTIPYSSFTPVWNETLLEQAAQIAAICWETMTDVLYFDIPDMQEYLKTQQQRLKEKGLDKASFELQKQVDEWIESYGKESIAW